jgi:hypothetical protein
MVKTDGKKNKNRTATVKRKSAKIIYLTGTVKSSTTAL